MKRYIKLDQLNEVVDDQTLNASSTASKEIAYSDEVEVGDIIVTGFTPYSMHIGNKVKVLDVTERQFGYHTPTTTLDIKFQVIEPSKDPDLAAGDIVTANYDEGEKIGYYVESGEIVGSTTEESYTSQVSFDFSYQSDYDRDAIEDVVAAALSKSGEFIACDFYSVDYSMYPEYSDKNISQCSADFRWHADYNRDQIEDDIYNGMNKLGYEVVGIDFYSLDIK